MNTDTIHVTVTGKCPSKNYTRVGFTNFVFFVFADSVSWLFMILESS